MFKILVPVDFSDTSLNALDYAIDVFGEGPLQVTLVHTYRSHSSAFHMKSLDRVLEEDSRREMDALTKRLEKEHPNVLVKPVIIKGDAVSAVTSMGDSGDYDFIVMGTKGASGLKEVFVGSVAGGVIAGTTAPVIVVPSGHAFDPIEKIVFAVGDVPLADTTVEDPLRTLIEILGCEVDILHVTDEDEPDVNKFVEPVKDLGGSVHIAHGSGDVHDHINAYLAEAGAGMICLVRSKRGFFSRIFSESVTTKQTFDSPVPLLVLHS